MSEVDIKNEERRFEIEDLFYSRTDDRGVIAAGNTVFQSVSGYEWDGLLGAPHKVIRHPHMPKGVFWLVWNRLTAGRPTAAFIKNMAKDGTYYWVMANITPVEGGYLSVRLKPTSHFLPTITEIYEELLAAEADEGISPEESGGRLRARLVERGYQDYDEFSAAALSSEVTARTSHLDREPDAELARFRTISDAVKDIEASIGEVVKTFRSIRMVPSNMRIIATRLEPTGGPISTIAVNYAAMAREMETWVQAFLESEDSGFMQMRRSVTRALYLASASRLQRDGASTFAAETWDGSHGDQIHEQNTLELLSDNYESGARDALSELANSGQRLVAEQSEMKRYVTGLSSTRTLCRVENARLADDGGSLDGIVDSLDSFQTIIDQQLTAIGNHNRHIQTEIGYLLETSSRGSRPPQKFERMIA